MSGRYASNWNAFLFFHKFREQQQRKQEMFDAPNYVSWIDQKVCCGVSTHLEKVYEKLGFIAFSWYLIFLYRSDLYGCDD